MSKEFFGKDMLSYTHCFQQSHPHTLTADYSLVPVDAGTYGIPHVFFIPVTNRGMDLSANVLPVNDTESRTGCGNDETTGVETSPTERPSCFHPVRLLHPPGGCPSFCRHYPACTWLRARRTFSKSATCSS